MKKMRHRKVCFHSSSVRADRRLDRLGIVEHTQDTNSVDQRMDFDNLFGGDMAELD